MILRYVFDNSALSELVSHCKLYQCLESFSQNHELLIPTRVHEEFINGNPDQDDLDNLQSCFEIIEVSEQETLLPYFDNDNTPGEFWVISYGLIYPDAVLVIDEGKGRFIANFFELNLIGTVGLLKMLKEAGLLDGQLLVQTQQTIKKGTFYLSNELENELEAI